MGSKLSPEGEYETLAGFVLDRLGRIPKEGDAFVYDGWRIEVAEMDRRAPRSGAAHGIQQSPCADKTS